MRKSLVATVFVLLSSAAHAGASGPAARAIAEEAPRLVQNVRHDQVLDPEEVRRFLRAKGYHAIRITDDRPPTYRAEACQNGRLYRLSIDSAGSYVVDKDLVGDCDAQGGGSERVLDPREIETYLRARGFRRIDVVDRSPPNYRADACRDDEAYRLVIDQYGRIRERENIGRCERGGHGDDRVSLERIRDMLRHRDYSDIRLISERGDRYILEACYSNRQFRLEVDSQGDITFRDAIGWCSTASGDGTRVAGFRRFVTDGDLNGNGRVRGIECQDLLDALTDTSSILFETGSANLRPQTYPLLRRIARIASRCPEARIEVAGFTDRTGDRDNNRLLSQERAQAVVDFLVSQGVPRHRLVARGYGESQPLTTGDTATERALNRRIEFVVSWGR